MPSFVFRKSKLTRLVCIHNNVNTVSYKYCINHIKVSTQNIQKDNHNYFLIVTFLAHPVEVSIGTTRLFTHFVVLLGPVA